uniref:Uncharacterized protein n=1 Tax=Cacopsylla melanoneura TaxID=428564 RepID=A0A8D8W803_9HEMI
MKDYSIFSDICSGFWIFNLSVISFMCLGINSFVMGNALVTWFRSYYIGTVFSCLFCRSCEYYSRYSFFLLVLSLSSSLTSFNYISFFSYIASFPTHSILPLPALLSNSVNYTSHSSSSPLRLLFLPSSSCLSFPLVTS